MNYKKIDTFSNWTKDEKDQLSERTEQCIKIIQSFTTLGISKTMSVFNGK